VTGRPVHSTDPSADDDSDDLGADGQRLGIFRSWRALYVTVVVYTFAMVALLYVATRLLDHSAR